MCANLTIQESVYDTVESDAGKRMSMESPGGVRRNGELIATREKLESETERPGELKEAKP